MVSLPSRERGLKYSYYHHPLMFDIVAPFAGAWIEILSKILVTPLLFVAPFAGAWIEMLMSLKYPYVALVAPFAGAWIEI